MLNAKDLRIGNLVKKLIYGTGAEPVAESIIEVKKICDVAINFGIAVFDNKETTLYFTEDYTFLKALPIGLTEKWLLKFGFNCIEKNKQLQIKYYITNNFCIAVFNNIDFRFTGIENGVKILYVHQLQNLYYAITGKELQTT